MAVWFCHGGYSLVGALASRCRGGTPLAPMDQGREVDALRQLEKIGGVRRPMTLLLARDSAMDPGSSVSFDPYCCGRRRSPNISRTRTSGLSSHTKCRTCGAATTWLPRCIWQSKPFSGLTPWCGGWERAWWRNANSPAMKRCCSGQFAIDLCREHFEDLLILRESAAGLRLWRHGR